MTPRKTTCNADLGPYAIPDDPLPPKSRNVAQNAKQEAAQRVMESAANALERLTSTLPQEQQQKATEKDEDDIFAELLGKILKSIPDSEDIDLLKCDLQQMVVRKKYEIIHGSQNRSRSVFSSPTYPPRR